MKPRVHKMMTADATGTVRAATVNVPSVLLNQNAGEHLFYRVTAQGANPAWVFSCTHRDVIRKSTTEPGHPKAIYEWTMAGADFDSTDDVYSVTMVFGPAIAYEVLTEHRDANGNLIEVLTDLPFRGGNPGDFAREELHVFVL